MKKLYIFLAFSLLFLVFLGCKDKNNSIPTKKQEIPTSTNVKQEDLNNSIGNILIPNMVQEDAQINHNENLNSGSNTEYINNQVKADCKTLNEQLFDSILQNDLDSVKNLIDEGADINAKDSVSGFYPIMVATIHGHKDIVEFFIKNNANLNVRDGEDFNAA